MESTLGSRHPFRKDSQEVHLHPGVWETNPNFHCGSERVDALLGPCRPTIAESTTLREAARLMESEDMDHVVVTDPAGRPLGYLGIHCMLRHLREEEAPLPHDTLAGKRMRPFQRTLLMTSLFRETMDVLIGSQEGVIPVVDGAGVLVGSLSSRDLLRAISSQLEQSLLLDWIPTAK